MITDGPTHPSLHINVQLPIASTPPAPALQKKTAHNIIAVDFSGALSPARAQAGYLYPNTPMALVVFYPLPFTLFGPG